MEGKGRGWEASQLCSLCIGHWETARGCDKGGDQERSPGEITRPGRSPQDPWEGQSQEQRQTIGGSQSLDRFKKLESVTGWLPGEGPLTFYTGTFYVLRALAVPLFAWVP